MSTVRDLLAMKNSAVVFTCEPGCTVAEACRVLRDRKVGCLVVVGEGGEVRGIFTERDAVIRAIADGRQPDRTRVDEVMTRDAGPVPLDLRCEELERLLRARRTRHVPVAGPRGLLGVVSLGDLARFYAALQ